ncbi:MAG: hypothetical protein M3Y80_07960 [Verrucomicrobiota bacterium]|nr:hypothetical protein [Verrucomicrobiota bacterium]
MNGSETPKPNEKEPFSIEKLVEKLAKNEEHFADTFVSQLQRAQDNDAKAIAYVNSYLKPSKEELTRLFIPRGQWGAMRVCTDAGNLLAATARASGVAQFL